MNVEKGMSTCFLVCSLEQPNCIYQGKKSMISEIPTEVEFYRDPASADREISSAEIFSLCGEAAPLSVLEDAGKAPPLT